ncbi:hypothetical protein [Pseudomonas songnenensis]|uniref:Uncharacterized protein n=1 Tax=Pseudomonas songnenensis TaxID=1176259 RepID=A0A482UDA8_9PSED|nr:hypothetical protein [Pseudomonas songnenensis]RYJ63257.1 hypothetical protein EJA06_004710 [Pseudomonas songnenensis]
MARVLTKKSTVPGKVPLATDLEIGELAVNTADAKLYTKHSDNTIKQLGGDAASGYFRTEPITATASGQTSFTVPGGYTPGAIFVSLNGATLTPADYVATNGSTVVLASGAGIVVGSVLLVHVLSAFEVADALPLGGTAADSSKLGGTAAAEFYRQGNILGTVSQSAGVPTGAIIERGSNANGEYVRFADGTQICWRNNAESLTVDSVNGNLFRSSVEGTWMYPAAFSAAYPISGAAAPETPAARWASYLAGTTSLTYRHWGGTTSPTIVATAVIAIGRWR